KGADVQRVRPAYVFLGRTPLSRHIEAEFAEDPSERTENFRIAKEVVFLLMNEIADPSIPFSPTSDLQQHCPTCPFTTLCGTQWVQGWKR
ncbi:MAG TPA: PD-(D/E)XK nuclease family protein, partial [Bacteroidota bacterium]|nr:PD-(D/E)XK nuclease family protein [Bacteroidota bacterium]